MPGRDGVSHNIGLTFDGGERLIHKPRAGLHGGEQIAEAAAHFAERQMHIEKEILPVLVLPRLLERHGRIKRAIGHLVRIGVGVAVVTVFGQPLGERSFHSMKSA